MLNLMMSLITFFVQFSLSDQNTLPQSNSVVNKQIVSQASSETQSVVENFVPSGSQDLDSSIAKFFFNPPPVSTPINSPIPKTPTRTTEQVDYIKSSHCISPVKTDSNKGSSLDFDASNLLEISDKPLPNEISMHESDKQNDLPELANLTYDDNYDYMWENISVTNNDLLADFPFTGDGLETFIDLVNDPDLPWGEFDFSDQPTPNHLKDNASGYCFQFNPEVQSLIIQRFYLTYFYFI